MTSGQHVQVALAWDSKTSGTDNWAKVDTLTTDLDLHVTLPNGTMATSNSANNAYEFVNFTAASGGNVTVKVVVFRLSSGSQPYSVAWTKYTTP